MWVRYCKTTNTTVYCMSVLLIHMSNFSFCTILSFHPRCSETRVVGLTNTVIIVTCFDWDQHSVFDIVIVMCECNVSKLWTLRSILCQRCWYTCLTFLFILFSSPICSVLYQGLFNGTWIFPMHLALCNHFSSKKHNIS